MIWKIVKKTFRNNTLDDERNLEDVEINIEEGALRYGRDLAK